MKSSFVPHTKWVEHGKYYFVFVPYYYKTDKEVML